MYRLLTKNNKNNTRYKNSTHPYPTTPYMYRSIYVNKVAYASTVTYSYTH